MNGARYLVAKYVPDELRMEPRNIGVIVWMPGQSAARFIAERPDYPGTIDGRSVPTYVNSASAFRQWVEYWRSVLGRDALQPVTGGLPIPNTAPEFIEALMKTGRGNYILTEGGVLLDDVGADELPQVAEHLYWTLVDPRGAPAEEARDPALDQVCDEIIHNVQLDLRPEFRFSYPVECRIGDATETYTFSYAFEGTKVKRLYQRVALSKQPTTLRKTVHDCGWMFDHVVREGFVQPDNCVSLVYVGDGQQSDALVRNALGLLKAVGRVLNVQDRAAAETEFGQLAHSAH